uniref:Uncharacterized protein n=1 Tax=Helianthus annuus TaxID=4232 RepID=A0A251V0J0_HELAN
MLCAYMRVGYRAAGDPPPPREAHLVSAINNPVYISLLAPRCILWELAVWEAGVVMGQDTRNRNTRLMVFTCGL